MKNVALSGEMPKRNVYVEIIAALLLLFFLHTLIRSYVQFISLTNMLAFYTKKKVLVAYAILILELLISILVFIPRTRIIGFLLAMLIGLFAVITIFKLPYVPHDFGGIINSLSHVQRIFLLILIVILSATGIILTRLKNKRSSI